MNSAHVFLLFPIPVNEVNKPQHNNHGCILCMKLSMVRTSWLQFGMSCNCPFRATSYVYCDTTLQSRPEGTSGNMENHQNNIVQTAPTTMTSEQQHPSWRPSLFGACGFTLSSGDVLQGVI